MGTSRDRRCVDSIMSPLILTRLKWVSSGQLVGGSKIHSKPLSENPAPL
jgi:hypothetical protein